MSALPVALADIRRAAAAIAGAVARTPTVPAMALSEQVGAQVYLKLETLHATGSFKERGALNKLLSLKAAERRAGVVAMSAGNHAQGVAYHAQRLGIPATIVMPQGTPFTKIDRTEAFGARVVLHGDSFGAARAAADGLARERGLVLIHPYDDPAVIAGQGTIALELFEDCPGLDAVIVPIGGGGLISGIAVAAKALDPRVAIVGVQSALYPAMHRLFHGIGPEPPDAAATIAEGIAVKEPGRLTRRIVKALVSDIRLVDEKQLESAVELLIEQQKLVAEGAGAAGVATLLAAPESFRGRKIGIVISGANIDLRLLASILMRGLVRSGRLVRLRSELPDVPGALSRLSKVIGAQGGNIVEVHHQRLFQDLSPRRAEVDIVVETQSRRHVAALAAALAAAGFPTQLLSHDNGGERAVAQTLPPPAGERPER